MTSTVPRLVLNSAFGTRSAPTGLARTAFVATLPVYEKMTDETARDMNVIWASIEAAALTWRGGQNIRFPGMPEERKKFWGAFALDHKPMSLPVIEEFLSKISGEGKLAIDLGCGSGPATQSLLRKGWRVVAVDYSREVLAVLEQAIREENAAWLNPERLQIVQEDVTTFTPREPADLVVVSDILPYIDPKKFRATWMKIHETFVKKNGWLIGTLFRSVENPVIGLMQELGAWFLPDRRMVRPLLREVGYTIETCQYRIDFRIGEDQVAIQFVGRKN